MRGIQNIEVLEKSGKVVTLWENPNPQSEYGINSITLPTDEQYDLLLFEFTWKASYASNAIQTEIVEPKTTFLADSTTGTSTGVVNDYRQVTYNGDHVYTISNAYHATGATAESVINTNMIPKKICGINLGVSGGISGQGWKFENIVITNGEIYGQMIKALINPSMPLDLGKEYLVVRTSSTFTHILHNNFIEPYEVYLGSDTGQGGLPHNYIYGYSRNTDISSVKGFVTDINGAMGVTDYTGRQTAVGDIFTFYSRPLLSSTELAVVDDIQTGNMNPITSNAVARFKSLFTPKVTGGTITWGSTAHFDVNYTVTDATFRLITGFSIAGGNGLVAVAAVRFNTENTITVRLVRTGTISQNVFISVYYI